MLHRFTCVLVVGLVCTRGASAADPVTVEARGQGATIEDAIADARVRATQQGAADAFAAIPESSQRPLVIDMVSWGAASFLTDVIEIGRNEDGAKLRTVDIRATVSVDGVTAAIERWAGLFLPDRMPRYAVELKLRRDGQVAPSPEASAALATELSAMGLSVVDRAAFEEGRAQRLAAATAAGDADRVAAIASEHAVDIVIMGVIAVAEERVARAPGAEPDICFAWAFEIRAVAARTNDLVAVLASRAKTRGLESKPETAAETFARGLDAECRLVGRHLRRQSLGRWFFKRPPAER